MEIERRVLQVEIRAAGDSDKPLIEGDAAVFNQETVIGEWFREMILPGAFKRILSEKPDVIAAYNHDWNIVLGRTTAGTLALEETDKSLRYSAEINTKDPVAMGVYERVKRGDVSQASFAFKVRKEEWTSPAHRGELSLRTIIEIDKLYDVGPVTFGAYAEASAQARSKANEFLQIPDAAGGQEPPAGEQSDSAMQEQAGNERRRLDFLRVKINP